MQQRRQLRTESFKYADKREPIPSLDFILQQCGVEDGGLLRRSSAGQRDGVVVIRPVVVAQVS